MGFVRLGTVKFYTDNVETIMSTSLYLNQECHHGNAEVRVVCVEVFTDDTRPRLAVAVVSALLVHHENGGQGRHLGATLLAHLLKNNSNRCME